ncbi:M61 family metallopeptidase [Flavisphingomonas formosensis]|uniref:M61 family metallopeptidase n=1 Tax=Flavisphingomonas formosensis TaxID=861534 RepID=UPI0012F97600|nr:PDZ domain-containing protein [Sphingomonas formosensis]
MRSSLLAIASCLLLATAPAAHAANSAPQPLAVVDTIPPARDVAWPGTIRLAVDVSDVTRGIFRVKESIPVSAAGPLVLLFPKWLPGDHQPSGEIEKLVGLKISAGGKPVEWRRDPVDVYAFHVTVPEGAGALDLDFQFVSATADNQGRIVATPDMVNLQWNSVALYPAGYFVRNITFDPSLTLPAGWTAATALDAAPAEGATLRYKPVPFDVLVDSPVYAGRYRRTETLAEGVRLNVFADRPEQLAMTPDVLAAHRSLVAQAVKLFGAQHYDHYDFLLAVTDRLGGIGLEHHRSSENSGDGDFLTNWKNSVAGHDLLPHEYTHSWNGKFRRPADLWTPDYRQPMRDSLLWVYEGQTQFWGYVLAARSGLLSKEETLGALAMTAAVYDTRVGRTWRPLIDTTNDPIMADRPPLAWRSWQRSEDYYSEGQLVWLDVDSLIREKSGGRKSLDDFARAFFGLTDRDYGEVTYTFDDVVATLNTVMPYDWAGFLRQRLDKTSEHAPLDWVARGGYRLTYAEEPTTYFKAAESDRKIKDLTFSIGLVIGKGARVTSVQWDGPAFQAGITVGSEILAVNGRTYDDDLLKDAIKAAKGGTKPITLLIKQGEVYRSVDVQWNGGLRYPRLERVGGGASTLDALLAPRS